MEKLETLVDSLQSFLHQMDERLLRHEKLIETSLRRNFSEPMVFSPSGPCASSMERPDPPETRKSPAFHPGRDLTSDIVEEAPRSPKSPLSEADGDGDPEPNFDLNSPISQPANLIRLTSNQRGTRLFKPVKQNSYELAQEEESRMVMPGTSSPSIHASEMPQFQHIHKGRPCRKYMAKIVSTWQFETVFALFILAHAILLGVQIEWECQNLDAELPSELGLIHIIFSCVFLVEIILRIIAFGMYEFCKGESYAWNLVDLFLVFIAMVEILADAFIEDNFASGSFRVLRILRLARSARGLRIVRLLRFIRPLRLLVFSIAITLKSLVWSIILLFIIIYLFSILFADANLSYFKVGNIPPLLVNEDDLQFHFGSVSAAMNTMFRAIAGGLEWRHASSALASSIGQGWSLLFTSYIAFCCFAVLNVMTGVFCHSAITGAEQDHEIMVQSMVNEQDRIRHAFADLFHLMDKDGSGTITIKEFEKGFHVDTTKALFEALGLKAEDAWTLFRSLDKDGDHRVGEHEFVQGCIHIRGPARQVDLRRQAQRTRSQLDGLEINGYENLALLKEMAEQMGIDPGHILEPMHSERRSSRGSRHSRGSC